MALALPVQDWQRAVGTSTYSTLSRFLSKVNAVVIYDK